MQVASLERHVRASDVPPERLAGNSQLSEQDKVAEVEKNPEHPWHKLLGDLTANTFRPQF